MVSLKEWLDNHPAQAVLGIAVSVATATAGITTYFTEQLHKTDKAQIERKHNVEMSDLRTRLSSIERRAGPNQPKRYFDVVSMQMSSSEIRNLPTGFTSFDNGLFYLNTPSSQKWTYGLLPQTEFTKLGLFAPVIGVLDASIRAILEKQIGHTWSSNPAADVRYAFLSDDLDWIGPLTSQVRIQKMSRQFFAENAARFATLQNRPQSEAKKVDSAVEAKKVDSAVNEIERLRKEEDAKANVEGTDIAATMKLFEQLFDEDMSGLVFTDTLAQNFQISMVGPEKLSFIISSAQKQANVMYLDLEIRLLRAKIEKSYDEFCRVGSSPTIVIRREFFFISYGPGGYLISIQVPTCDGRSKAFDWINEWLAGLRIAVRG